MISLAIGIPEINLKLRELAKAKNTNASSDIILLVLKGAKATTFVASSESDIPSDLEENNKKLVLDALKGGTEDKVLNGYVVPVSLTPQKVIVKVVANETSVADALEECKTLDFTILAVPPAVKADNEAIKNFVDYMYQSGLGCMAVIKDGDGTIKNRNLIRYATTAEGYDSTGGTTSELSARIAGVVAGVPLTQSPTYQITDDIKVKDKLSRTEIDNKVKAGELVIANISGHTRIVRGVTSFPSEGPKPSPFSKIKLVQGYNFIQNAVKDVLVNNYVGKTQNGYSDKIALCVAIKTELLDNLDFVEEGSIVEIDTEAQRAYLKTQGVDVSNMTDDEIDRHKTNTKVFLNLFFTVYDAMEDFDINMNIEN